MKSKLYFLRGSFGRARKFAAILFVLCLIGVAMSAALAAEPQRKPPPPPAGSQTPRHIVIDGGILNEHARLLPKAEYPRLGNDVKVSGTVEVRVLIDETGAVISATAISGHPLLRASAVSAARGASFEPSMLSGAPARLSGTLVYEFTAPVEESRTPGSQAYIADGGIVNDRAISLPEPRFPPLANLAPKRDTILVKVIIDKDGSVTSATAFSGHPLLRLYAEDAARKARFQPTVLSTGPTRVSGVLIYHFDSATVAPLDDDPLAVPAIKPPSPPIVVDGGELTDRASSIPRARYPPVAASAHASGTVRVRVIVAEQGEVISSEAISGPGLLRSAAAFAARGAKFGPTKLAGELVRMTGIISFKFRDPYSH